MISPLELLCSGVFEFCCLAVCSSKSTYLFVASQSEVCAAPNCTCNKYSVISNYQLFCTLHNIRVFVRLDILCAPYPTSCRQQTSHCHTMCRASLQSSLCLEVDNCSRLMVYGAEETRALEVVSCAQITIRRSHFSMQLPSLYFNRKALGTLRLA